MDMRLSQLHKAFLADLAARGSAVNTIGAYRSDFEILKDFLGGDDPRLFTPDKMLDFPNWLMTRRTAKTRGEKGHSTRGIARRIASAASFGRWLVKRREFKVNPLDIVDRPKRPKSLPRPIPTEWVDILLGLDLTPMERAILIVMRYGGLRVSEVVNLDLEDYNGRTIIVREGKGNKDRVIPVHVLGTVVIGPLDGWTRTRGPKPGPLFRNPTGERLTRKVIARMIHRLTRRASLPGFTPHQLRHTFATWMMEEGVALPVLQEIMGHERAETTSQYMKVSGRLVEDAFRRAHDEDRARRESDQGRAGAEGNRQAPEHEPSVSVLPSEHAAGEGKTPSQS